MNSEDKIIQVENPQLVGREQIAVYVPVDEILDGMANDPDERFKGDTGPEGAEGPQGPQGPQGEQGPPGNDYVLTSADKDELKAYVKTSILEGKW